MTDILAELRALRRQRPFVPFNIVLKDGRRFAIGRPLQYAFNDHLVLVIDDKDRIERFRPEDIAETQTLHSVS